MVDKPEEYQRKNAEDYVPPSIALLLLVMIVATVVGGVVGLIATMMAVLLN